MLGAYSCHSCFLRLLERIARDFCGVMLVASSYHCLAARIGDLHERVGDLHVCKLQCFSSLRLWHHAKELVTYMFASCSASVHYGITQKGWRPTCLQAAELQFTMYHCARVGDLHVCKLAALHFMRASTGW